MPAHTRSQTKALKSLPTPPPMSARFAEVNESVRKPKTLVHPLSLTTDNDFSVYNRSSARTVLSKWLIYTRMCMTEIRGVTKRPTKKKRATSTQPKRVDTPPWAPKKKLDSRNHLKTPISPVNYRNYDSDESEVIISQPVLPSKVLTSDELRAKFPSDSGTPLLGEIRKRSIEQLTTYFTQLFHLGVFTAEINDDFLEMKLTDVPHSSLVYIEGTTLKHRLKHCGFRFSSSAIALYMRVLDPCCILIGSDDGIQNFTIDKAVRAMLYCLEMELFGLQTDSVFQATKRTGQRIIETVPICYI